MLRRPIITLLLCMLLSGTYAQPNIFYWNKVSYLKMGGGTIEPGNDMKRTGPNGLFAKDGFQVFFDYNYMIAYGLGLGANLEFNQFHFNHDAFMEFAQPQTLEVRGGYNFTKFGLNALFNLPIVVHPQHFTINFFIEGNAGIRGMSIPSIDMEYNEIENKFVEVNYRSRTSTGTYLGYSGGIQLLFGNRFGINASYNVVEPSRHSIRYSVRKFDADGNLFEDENYLNNYLDHSGLQFGILFMFGKR